MVQKRVEADWIFARHHLIDDDAVRRLHRYDVLMGELRKIHAGFLFAH